MEQTASVPNLVPTCFFGTSRGEVGLFEYQRLPREQVDAGR
jgi:hypothetical protein